ncbi:uncharacterized protein ASCRUDRAFT_74983 [Ascoidea rubescens DSM 1968]|uniref:Uncharacterized protein n=1 Tax=Ascoidea rubescens DSM 1968 TaxID=1344418 RepID=A0A1D2VM67_9ASCO|nr:hypothetical protein ASCRUDRAFT_74983 [Ascoidea rubescens DSM 1968]ODV62645.1 hypothetical protein ASCRUDRAFT_74983 [Ascoidea rubescens DSM 1968]
MPSLTALAGWGAFGAGVRFYQLGLLQRNQAKGIVGYALSSALWVGIGYTAIGFYENQQQVSKKRIASLLEKRAKRAAAQEAEA